MISFDYLLTGEETVLALQLALRRIVEIPCILTVVLDHLPGVRGRLLSGPGAPPNATEALPSATGALPNAAELLLSATDPQPGVHLQGNRKFRCWIRLLYILNYGIKIQHSSETNSYRFYTYSMNQGWKCLIQSMASMEAKMPEWSKEY